MKKKLIKLLPILFVFSLSGCSILEDFYVIGTENGQDHTHADGSYIPGVNEEVSEEEWNDEIKFNNFFYASGNITIRAQEITRNSENKKVTVNRTLENENGKIHFVESEDKESDEAYLRVSNDFDEETKTYHYSRYYYSETVDEKNVVISEIGDYCPEDYKSLAGLYDFDYSSFKYDSSKHCYSATNVKINQSFTASKVVVTFNKRLLSKIEITISSSRSLTASFSNRGTSKVNLPKAEGEEASYDEVLEKVWDKEINSNDYFRPESNVTITLKEGNSYEEIFENDNGDIKWSRTVNNSTASIYVKVSDNYDDEEDLYLNSIVITDVNNQLAKEEFDYSPSQFKTASLIYGDYSFKDFEYDNRLGCYFADDITVTLWSGEEVFNRIEVYFLKDKINKVIVFYDEGYASATYSKLGKTSVTIPDVDDNNEEDEDEIIPQKGWPTASDIEEEFDESFSIPVLNGYEEKAQWVYYPASDIPQSFIVTIEDENIESEYIGLLSSYTKKQYKGMDVYCDPDEIVAIFVRYYSKENTNGSFEGTIIRVFLYNDLFE